jgi:hypothetical protein
MARTLVDLVKENIARNFIMDQLKRFAKSRLGKMLQGYKTYIVAVVLVVIAALKFMGIEIPGVSDNSDPGALISVALGLVFARHGAKTEVDKVK